MKRFLISFTLTVSAATYSFFYMLASSSDRPVLAQGLILIALLVLLFIGAGCLSLFKEIRIRIPLYLYPIAFMFLCIVFNIYGVAQYTGFSYAVSHTGFLIFNIVFLIARVLFLYGGMTLIAFLIGDLVLHKLFRSREGEVGSVIAIATGYIAISFFVMFLAYFSAVYPWLMVPLLAAAACNRTGWKRLSLLLRERWQDLRSHTVPLWSYQNLWYSSLVVIGAFVFIGASWPIVVNGDSLLYYFTIPELMLQNHGFVPFPYWPPANSVIVFSYAYIPFLLVDKTLINYAGFYFFLLSAPALLAIARRYVTEDFAWLASWLFLMVPLSLHFLMINPKIDLMNIYFLLAGFMVFWNGLQKDRQTLVALAAFIFGFAFSIKFNSLLLAPGFLFMIFLFWMPQKARRFFTLIRTAALFVGVLGVTILLLNLRTYLTTGHLFYPYVDGRFYSFVAQTPAERSLLDTFFEQSYFFDTGIGFHRTFLQNARNFFSKAINTELFNYGPLLALLSIGSLWTLAFKRWRHLGVLCIVALGWWYVQVRVVGYYFDFLIPFGALVAVVLWEFMYPFARRYVVVLVALIMSLNLAVGYAIGNQLLFVNQVLPASAMGSFAQPYFLTDELNNIIDQNPRALFLSLQSEIFSMKDSNVHRFDNLPPYYLALRTMQADTPGAIRALLRRDGITHIIDAGAYIIADKILQRCRADAAECSLFEQVLDRIRKLPDGLDPSVTKGEYRVYAL